MKKSIAVLLCALFVLIFVVAPIFFSATPIGKGLINTWFYQVQKVDDKTNYATRKQVEDTCRSMMSSYTSDKLTYEQYKDSPNKEKQSWAEQARMRANKTASSYNNYVLKNSFVWEYNIPADIVSELPYL
ncbi:MAG: hypothetical protein NC177_14835 [Ruminococcus flavefaciens]|nr:hypothetical protein [Ruminococcus flavefaciens]